MAIGMVGAGVLVLLAAIVLLRANGLGPWAPSLSGAIIDPPMPAADFTLHDQSDQPVRLSSFRGKVVVLTFLYTHCPDACPLITEKLHQAYGQLGPDVSRMAILAVTVDPERDTVPQVRAYSAQKDMLDKWHFLVGPARDVQPIWGAYGVVAAQPDQASGQGSTVVPAASPATTPATGGNSLVDHSAPIFLIDRSGQARVILDINFEPAELVQDVRVLLRE